MSVVNETVSVLRKKEFYRSQNLCESNLFRVTQPAFTCLKLSIETLEQCVKYVRS